MRLPPCPHAGVQSGSGELHKKEKYHLLFRVQRVYCGMDERQELEDEYNARYGDPRRCPVHGRVTSSPDGIFDAPCPECEGEMMYDELEDSEEDLPF